MPKELIKGNESIIKGAILAGCRLFFGYPITPASEIAHAAAYYIPLVGGTFLQAESEVGAINMVYGASCSGIRVMTASSSPGISLKQEGISYLAGSELPCVFIDIMRGGPGLGNIAPEQGDYNQIVKGGGHGNYKVIVLAPNSAQEMCDLTILAFELADKYLNPACVLTDGFIGQMMEPVVFPDKEIKQPQKDWAFKNNQSNEDKLFCSIALDPDDLEKHNSKLQEKYKKVKNEEVRFEEKYTDDAEMVVIGFGIVSRVLLSVVEKCRNEGLKIGYLRPITLWPFPTERIKELRKQGKAFLVVEMNNGQMLDDVRLAAGEGRVEFHNRMGGNVPTQDEVYNKIKNILEG